MAKELGITKEHLMLMVAEEKEHLATYEMSCKRYKIHPNQIAIAVAKSKIQLLEDLMNYKKMDV